MMASTSASTVWYWTPVSTLSGGGAFVRWSSANATRPSSDSQGRVAAAPAAPARVLSAARRVTTGPIGIGASKGWAGFYRRGHRMGSPIYGRRMTSLTRRESLRLFGGGLAGAALWPAAERLARAAGQGVHFKVGVTDWNLERENQPEAIALAKRLGFDGVQVSLGKGKDRLPLADPALQKTYLEESKRAGLPIA